MYLFPDVIPQMFFKCVYCCFDELNFECTHWIGKVRQNTTFNM